MRKKAYKILHRVKLQWVRFNWWKTVFDLTFVPLSERWADFGERTEDVGSWRDVGNIGHTTVVRVRVVAVDAWVTMTWSLQLWRTCCNKRRSVFNRSKCINTRLSVVNPIR